MLKYCVLILVALLIATPGFAVNPESQSAESGITEKLGIQPLGVMLTAVGTMLEFRYTVTDSEKSKQVFDRRTKTYLFDQASGSSLGVSSDTKMGPLRSSSRDPVAGKEYFIMFVNPGRQVKRGSKVTVVIGDMKIENLTVD